MSNKIYAMIPARIGSTRLKFKNIRLLHNKPLIWYGINAAQTAGFFDEIFLNSDEILLAKLAKEYKCKFYNRAEEYGSSIATADDVIYDFFKHNTECNILFWINTTNPFQPYQEYEKALCFFNQNNLDGLITTTKEKIHARFLEKPLNYSSNEKLPKTQDLEPVEIFAFPFSIWRRESFIQNYEKYGYAYLCGNIGYWQVNKLASIEIDDEDDFILANSILFGLDNQQCYEKKYANLED